MYAPGAIGAKFFKGWSRRKECRETGHLEQSFRTHHPKDLHGETWSS